MDTLTADCLGLVIATIDYRSIRLALTSTWWRATLARKYEQIELDARETIKWAHDDYNFERVQYPNGYTLSSTVSIAWYYYYATYVGGKPVSWDVNDDELETQGDFELRHPVIIHNRFTSGMRELCMLFDDDVATTTAVIIHDRYGNNFSTRCREGRDTWFHTDTCNLENLDSFDDLAKVRKWYVDTIDIIKSDVFESRLVMGDDGELYEDGDWYSVKKSNPVCWLVASKTMSQEVYDMWINGRPE